LIKANPVITVSVIRNFSSGYHSRNGGGDLIETDGDLPIIDLTRVDAPSFHKPEPTDSRDKRPAQTTFGAGIALLRGLTYLGSALTLVLFPGIVSRVIASQGVEVPANEIRTATILLAVILAVAATVDIGLGLAVLAGRNWARLVLMLFCVISTTVAFTANARGDGSYRSDRSALCGRQHPGPACTFQSSGA
jgi:hypothetical protein